MPKYATECDKMLEVSPKSQAIGEFIDWLQTEKGWVFAKKHGHSDGCRTLGDAGPNGDLPRATIQICGLRTGEYIPTSFRIEELLAEFFGIDLAKVETEKRAMLEEARNG